MKTTLTVRLHRHYIATTVRFNYTNESYVEYRVCDKDFPRIAFASISSLRHIGLCDDYLVAEKRDAFPTFPYPAYFEITLRFDSESDTNDFEVVEARFAQADKGFIVFQDVLMGSMVTPDLRRSVVAKMFNNIAELNADAIIKSIMGLSAASKHKFDKIV